MPARIHRTRFSMLLAVGLAAAGLGPVDAQEAPATPEAAPALPSPDPVAPIALGNVLPTKPIRRTANGFSSASGRAKKVFNERWIDTRPLPSDKPTTLDYADKSADFAVGQVITGEASKATAVVASRDDSGTSGTLTLAKVAGDFQDGETIADPAGGSAKVRGKLKEGVWVLDFAFKPLRLMSVEIPGKGRRTAYYLYYQVVNRTGRVRAFVPQFSLVVPETGKRYDDTVLPSALKLIQAREDPSIDVLGAVDIMGMLPISDQNGIDRAVFGVAIWEGIDPKADKFSIYVRGLSDYSFTVAPPDGGKPVTKHKTLRIDFRRRGDEHDLNEREIELLDPAYEWVYW